MKRIEFVKFFAGICVTAMLSPQKLLANNPATLKAFLTLLSKFATDLALGVSVETILDLLKGGEVSRPAVEILLEYHETKIDNGYTLQPTYMERNKQIAFSYFNNKNSDQNLFRVAFFNPLVSGNPIVELSQMEFMHLASIARHLKEKGLFDNEDLAQYLFPTQIIKRSNELGSLSFMKFRSNKCFEVYYMSDNSYGWGTSGSVTMITEKKQIIIENYQCI